MIFNSFNFIVLFPLIFLLRNVCSVVLKHVLRFYYLIFSQGLAFSEDDICPTVDRNLFDSDMLVLDEEEADRMYSEGSYNLLGSYVIAPIAGDDYRLIFLMLGAIPLLPAVLSPFLPVKDMFEKK